MRAVRAILVLFVLTALFSVGLVYAAPTAPHYVLIVNPKNPEKEVSRKFVADAFLKKTTRWSHGEAIRPADQAAKASVRRIFSEEVLKRSVAAVKNYWQQIVFTGRGVPPPELDNDAQVVNYVLKHAGGVGYVSGGAELRGAKVVDID